MRIDHSNFGVDPAWTTFADAIKTSSRILCLIGVGVSASAPSCLPTWRGSHGLWNDLDVKDLASPRGFAEDPATVWAFYSERLLESLVAQPNAAHRALVSRACKTTSRLVDCEPKCRWYASESGHVA